MTNRANATGANSGVGSHVELPSLHPHNDRKGKPNESFRVLLGNGAKVGQSAASNVSVPPNSPSEDDDSAPVVIEVGPDHPSRQPGFNHFLEWAESRLGRQRWTELLEKNRRTFNENAISDTDSQEAVCYINCLQALTRAGVRFDEIQSALSWEADAPDNAMQSPSGEPVDRELPEFPFNEHHNVSASRQFELRHMDEARETGNYGWDMRGKASRFVSLLKSQGWTYVRNYVPLFTKAQFTGAVAYGGASVLLYYLADQHPEIFWIYTAARMGASIPVYLDGAKMWAFGAATLDTKSAPEARQKDYSHARWGARAICLATVTLAPALLAWLYYGGHPAAATIAAINFDAADMRRTFREIVQSGVYKDVLPKLEYRRIVGDLRPPLTDAEQAAADKYAASCWGLVHAVVNYGLLFHAIPWAQGVSASEDWVDNDYVNKTLHALVGVQAATVISEALVGIWMGVFKCASAAAHGYDLAVKPGSKKVFEAFDSNHVFHQLSARLTIGAVAEFLATWFQYSGHPAVNAMRCICAGFQVTRGTFVGFGLKVKKNMRALAQASLAGAAPVANSRLTPSSAEKVLATSIDETVALLKKEFGRELRQDEAERGAAAIREVLLKTLLPAASRGVKPNDSKRAPKTGQSDSGAATVRGSDWVDDSSDDDEVGLPSANAQGSASARVDLLLRHFGADSPPDTKQPVPLAAANPGDGGVRSSNVSDPTPVPSNMPPDDDGRSVGGFSLNAADEPSKT